MAGLFRKIASAFVQVESAPASPGADSGLTSEADALIAQLEGSAGTTGDDLLDAEPLPDAPASSLPADTLAVLNMKPDEVYAQAGLVDGPAAAPRVVRMLVGLAQFPPPQQLAMLRALDSADDSWSEEEVLADARTRQGALRQHLQSIEQARATRLSALEQQTRDTSEQRQSTLAEIDAQMVELTKLREQALAESAAALAELETQKQEVELAADQSRRSITEVVNHLSALVSFFTSGGPPPRVG